MRVLLTGSSGFIGTALAAALAARGDSVVPVVRGEPQKGAVVADVGAGLLDCSRLPDGTLEGIDASVHLAGAPILGRWTPRRREEIRSSRIALGSLLASALAKLERPPSVHVTGSAVGYYGDRGEELLDESCPPGDGFLAGLCRAWEEAASPAAEAAIRTVAVRTGIVLGKEGGALPVQASMFRFGLGGRLGSGRQWVSWISREDAVRAILHALDDTTLSGPLNLVAPHAVRNSEFTRALAAAVRRPAVLAVPAPFLRLALGGGTAEEMLLASQHATPTRLLENGFRFEQPDLSSALSAGLA